MRSVERNQSEEPGVDPRYIEELFGHKGSKTREIYCSCCHERFGKD